MVKTTEARRTQLLRAISWLLLTPLQEVLRFLRVQWKTEALISQQVKV